ncbi:hypothetical protein [Kocuria palustris]|uniref:hypothetical protein n=1 Tax=Kocuria palustris TaxID=71999 RepID=UPI003D732E23
MSPRPLQERAIYFVPRRRIAGNYNMYGLTWKVRAEGSSFYFISRHQMNDRKISLHGPSASHPDTSWFKLAIDQTSGDRAASSELLPYGDEAEHPVSFPGCPVKKGVKHVLRFRWTPDLFVVGAPPAHHPGAVKGPKTQAAAWLEAPPEGHALDVDFYLSDGIPYVPRPTRTRRDNALLGPQINRLGQSLTGVVYWNSLKKHPTPEPLGGLFLPEVTEVWDCRRAIQAFRDPRGYLHIQERLVAREPGTSNENAG